MKAETVQIFFGTHNDISSYMLHLSRPIHIGLAIFQLKIHLTKTLITDRETELNNIASTLREKLVFLRMMNRIDE